MRITVITPAWNVARFIGATIASVQAQTHRDWSMLVIDDGSTDDTAAVVAAFDEPRLRLIRQANAGVSAARNRGIAAIDGAAVIFLDGDDTLAADAMARMCATLGGADAAYGAYCFTSEDGGSIVAQKSGPFPAGDIIDRLVVQNLFANGGHMLIRADALRRAGMFRADLRYGEDWEYWCRLAAIGRFAVVPGAAPLLYVRRRGGSAILSQGTERSALTPCLDAIFANPAIAGRVGAGRRRQSEAEIDWIIGRELLRHGRAGEGLGWLRRSLAGRPSARRAVLLLAAHALRLLPPRLHGPFRAYAAAGSHLSD